MRNSFTLLTAQPTEWLKLVGKLQQLALLRPNVAKALLGSFAKSVDAMLEDPITL